MCLLRQVINLTNMSIEYDWMVTMRIERLIAARVSRGFTQTDLAERVGISLKQMWRYENEVSIPAADVLKRIAQELEVSADYLLGLTDNPTDHYRETELTADERKLVNDMRAGRSQSLLENALRMMDTR